MKYHTEEIDIETIITIIVLIIVFSMVILLIKDGESCVPSTVMIIFVIMLLLGFFALMILSPKAFGKGVFFLILSAILMDVVLHCRYYIHA